MLLISDHNRSNSNKYSLQTFNGKLNYLNSGISEQEGRSSVRKTFEIFCPVLFILQVGYFKDPNPESLIGFILNKYLLFF